MRAKREISDGKAAGLVLTGVSPVVVLVSGLLFGWPLVVTLVGAAAAVVVALVVTAMTTSDERRDTFRWQEAAVTVAAWAGRNGGRSETSVAALAGDGWTLPDSPAFAGEILAVARRDEFEVGVACYVEHEPEGGPARHTAVLVRLPDAHPAVKGTPRRLRRQMAEPVAEALAALPGPAELVEIAERELRVEFFGWPPRLDLAKRVDAVIEVARVL
jgi:hypothetical protein